MDITIVPLEGEPDRECGRMGKAIAERCNTEEDRGCQPNAVG